MAKWHLGLLDEAQSAFVESHLGVPQLLKDMSWGLVDTTVLHVRNAAAEFVVKATGPNNHHLPRELAAYESFTADFARSGQAARLVAGDRVTNVLIVEYQEGELAQGTRFEWDPSIHQQAAHFLRAFHHRHSHVDQDYEVEVTAKALAWLDRPHRISPPVADEARQILGDYRPAPVVVVPTHGDWQPRNWLVHGDRLRVIDFGRFAFRPAASDLCRLATQQWREAPSLETTFLDAYGTDPRDPAVWPVDLLREAISTAAWAYTVGDEDFEEQGHRMLGEALARFS